MIPFVGLEMDSMNAPTAALVVSYAAAVTTDDLGRVRALLSKLYKPAQVEWWINVRRWAWNDRSAADLIADGRAAEVIALAEIITVDVEYAAPAPPIVDVPPAYDEWTVAQRAGYHRSQAAINLITLTGAAFSPQAWDAAMGIVDHLTTTIELQQLVALEGTVDRF